MVIPPITRRGIHHGMAVHTGEDTGTVTMIVIMAVMVAVIIVIIIIIIVITGTVYITDKEGQSVQTEVL